MEDVLARMPPLLRAVVEEVVAAEPDLELVREGEAGGDAVVAVSPDGRRAVISRRGAEVVLEAAEA